MKQKTYLDKPSRQKKNAKPIKKKLDKSKEPPQNRLLDVDYTSGFRPTRKLV